MKLSFNIISEEVIEFVGDIKVSTNFGRDTNTDFICRNCFAPRERKSDEEKLEELLKIDRKDNWEEKQQEKNFKRNWTFKEKENYDGNGRNLRREQDSEGIRKTFEKLTEEEKLKIREKVLEEEELREAYIVNDEGKFRKWMEGMKIIKGQKKKGYELQIRNMIREYLVMEMMGRIQKQEYWVWTF